jgi:hypothetical protein
LQQRGPFVDSILGLNNFALTAFTEIPDFLPIASDKMVQRYTYARPEFHANEIAKLPSIANMQTKAA